ARTSISDTARGLRLRANSDVSQPVGSGKVTARTPESRNVPCKHETYRDVRRKHRRAVHSPAYHNLEAALGGRAARHSRTEGIHSRMRIIWDFHSSNRNIAVDSQKYIVEDAQH